MAARANFLTCLAEGALRFASAFLCLLLALYLAFPQTLAFADDATGNAADSLASVPLEAGAYVEHEAIAYVREASGARAFSLGGGLLDSAENLMEVSAAAATEALGGEAGFDGDAVGEADDAGMSLMSLDAESQSAGRLVLVHDDAMTTQEIIAELERDDRVVFAEPNAINDVAADEDSAQAAEQAAEQSSSAVPDLNRFLWGFDNTGALGGQASAGIDMGYANWNSAAEKESLGEVVVAVLDSGIDATNPDLAPVLWDGSAYPELKTTGMEDDHGFSIDAYEGWFTSATDITNYHGTHVAGTIGAAWDDAGVSGLAPNVKLMSVRVGGSLSKYLQGFDYVNRAAKAGVNVKVTNNSWSAGRGQWKSLDLAVAQAGQLGVVSVFASGNAGLSTDTAPDTATALADNPYAVVVNSLNPAGEPSVFTEYSATSTDVFAPGSTILSTYGKAVSNYMAEADGDALLYQSFDEASKPARVGDSEETVNLTFGEGEVVANRSFDGSASLAIPITAQDRITTATSTPIDLSGQADKPGYLSIRYAVDQASPSSGTVALPTLRVGVKKMDGTFQTLGLTGFFGTGGSAWNGFYDELPEDTDWENFTIMLTCGAYEQSKVEGVNQFGPYLDGLLLVDSIGLGSSPIPYAYNQGTSMACPAVVGAAAVIAGKQSGFASEFLAAAGDDSAESAARLAALVKGAAQPADNLADLCSTGGFATVDGAENPGPSITTVEDNGDSVSVKGYFFGSSPSVTIDGAQAQVLSASGTELKVRKPEGFAGGQVVLAVGSENGKQAKHLADLGQRTDTTYFDQTSLPVPDEVALWGAWSLVGFDGSIYCLPSNAARPDTPSTPHDHMLRYVPGQGLWEEVALPMEILEKEGLSANIAGITGTTIDGSLLLLINDEYGFSTFVRFTAQGTWEFTGCSFQGLYYDCPVSVTLASDGQNAYLFGGFAKETTSSGGRAARTSARIRLVDLEDKALTTDSDFEIVGEFDTARMSPQVTYGNGSFLVSGGSSYETMGSVAGAELVTLTPSGTSEAATQADMVVTSEPVDFAALTTQTGQLAYASGALDGGFIITGAPTDDGTADTFTLQGDGSSALTAYGKRASQSQLLTPAATAYRGTYYVLAATQTAPYRTFAATAVETVAQSGDTAIPPSPEPGPGPEPEPEPEPTVVPSAGGGSSGTTPAGSLEAQAPAALAKTGDGLGVAAAVALLCAMASGCVVRFSRRKTLLHPYGKLP